MCAFCDVHLADFVWDFFLIDLGVVMWAIQISRSIAWQRGNADVVLLKCI